MLYAFSFIYLHIVYVLRVYTHFEITRTLQNMRMGIICIEAGGELGASVKSGE